MNLILKATLIIAPMIIFTQSPGPLWAQKDKGNDKKITLLINQNPDSSAVDSMQNTKAAPLDIGLNRGFFMSTSDGKMQMRIFGSVRFLVVYDNHDLADKNRFNTYDIPTGSLNQRQPNYYNGLSQTRLGVDVSRKAGKKTIMAYIETDFAGEYGFRIRHAYGRYGGLLVGQTWSLFSQITALPATVDFAGPTGAIKTRTPQIRYSMAKPLFGMKTAFALEYIAPDVSIPDNCLFKAFSLFLVPQ